MNGGTPPFSNFHWIAVVRHMVVVVATLMATVRFAAADTSEVSGVLIANGVEVELPYVYVWTLDEGFHDPADPSWRILFVEKEIEQRELGDTIWDAAWVEIGITETSEFADQPEQQIYLQSIKLSASAGGNLSGGVYPQFKLQGLGSERISGRIWHTETQEFFDDTYSYDFTFSASLSDPDAPIGELLPADGGDPGQAYMVWVETVHSGDLAALRSIVPEEMAEQLDFASAEETEEHIDFLQTFTPTDVRVLGGSSDGETAILDIEGMMEGEKVTAEVTMTRMGEFWLPTETSM